MQNESERGKYNSSKTRVYPAFSCLVKNNLVEKFLERIGDFLVGDEVPKKSLPPFSSIINIRFEGHTNKNGEKGEWGFGPNQDFLRWLLNCDDINFARMRKKSADCKKPDDSSSADDWRAWLLSPDKRQRDYALKKAKEAGGPKAGLKRWYVLESPSRPDVVIETNSFVLVIEGKRTEPRITDHTTWMKHRDQLIRHMDGAYDYAIGEKKKVYGLYIVEDPCKYNFKKYAGGPYRRGSSMSCWEESLPHRSQGERKYLKEHFLGHILWTDLLKIDKSICYIDSVSDNCVHGAKGRDC